MEYSKRMKTFIKSNEPFLSEMLKASKLMAWMCFGVTTNCSRLGTATLAASYILVKAESESNQVNPLINWNYHLASIHRQDPLSISQLVLMFETGGVSPLTCKKYISLLRKEKNILWQNEECNICAHMPETFV